MLRGQYLIDSNFWGLSPPPLFPWLSGKVVVVTASTERQIEYIMLKMHRVYKLVMKILGCKTVQRK